MPNLKAAVACGRKAWEVTAGGSAACTACIKTRTARSPVSARHRPLAKAASLSDEGCAPLDALRAFDGAPDRHEPRDGDSFYVRWEQTYSIEGQPIGIGRVLWAELKTQAGDTTAIHRFRPREGAETFFLTTGEAATPPAIA